MKKDTTLLIRINSDLKKKIQKVADEYEVSVSEIISSCLEDIARKGELNMVMQGRLGILRREEAKKHMYIFAIKKALEKAIEELELGDKIKKVYLYGSFARGEETPKSDIDLRLETSKISMFELTSLGNMLKEKTGRDVDISNKDVGKLDPLFYENVKKDEICIYECQGSATSSLHQNK